MPIKETSTAPLVRKNDQGLLVLTEEGEAALEPVVTDTKAQVYAFRKSENAKLAAGSMARLSRSSNDARTVIASEFLANAKGSEGLLKRVITEYGDDSVAQLDFDQVIFEGVSNIATKKLEHGRTAIAYLEQSTRYLRFDQKDEDERYKYVTPSGLDAKTATLYEKNLDEIFDIYSELYQRTLDHIRSTSTEPSDESELRAWKGATHAKACDVVRDLLPAATKSTVGVAGSAQAIYNMILRLKAESLQEVQDLSDAALAAVRVVNPVFYERADNPNRGGLISANKAKTKAESRALAQRIIAERATIKQKQGAYVTLEAVDGSKDELVAKILTDNSQYPYKALLRTAKGLSEGEKDEVLTTYVGVRDNRRVKPGRAFEAVRYMFEVQCDIGAYRDIQRHRIVDAFHWQDYQPYLGYSRPGLIDEVGGADLYERAFKLSQETYEKLVENGYADEAQYAVLFGHNIRFSFSMNARELFHAAELRTAIQGHPSYRKVYMDMVELVATKHPFVTRYMQFLNKDDNAELARLDAERAKQARLEALDRSI